MSNHVKIEMYQWKVDTRPGIVTKQVIRHGSGVIINENGFRSINANLEKIATLQDNHSKYERSEKLFTEDYIPTIFDQYYFDMDEFHDLPFSFRLI